MLKFFSLFAPNPSQRCGASGLILVSTKSTGLYEKPTSKALDDVLVGFFEVLNDFHDTFGNAYAVKRYPPE